ncbi:serine/arginine repetitive matrix protein 1-like [Varroa jacobsoni]|uniref:serine/arginine repetitive matrix protein 1-like n=1 Tax=Varroa jacobsoni TaxID=62625 RepID=UPI000BF71229|nr:serine/arginine repetitive matrix protein 1-like [Varroa jacobsoni]XP_022703496.1 serine/arginine repetitive matrix protein 1-like [Varroa jacobsoni]XP_022703497.1 serine/arginine repetitive matrix protein 1-like [Varroa jacobsoni]XP_022703498.1 serine/arginine repetitive matrix protein 1-like [Varroa jacobsoni]
MLPKVYGNLASELENLHYNPDSVVNPHSQVTDKKTISDLLNDPAVLTGIMVCSILLWAVFAAVLYNHFLKKPRYSSVPRNDDPSTKVSPNRKSDSRAKSKAKPPATRRSNKPMPGKAASPKIQKSPKGEKTPNRKSGTSRNAVSSTTAEMLESYSAAEYSTPLQAKSLSRGADVNRVFEKGNQSRDRHPKASVAQAGGDIAVEKTTSKKAVKSCVSSRHRRHRQHKCHSHDKPDHKHAAHEHVLNIEDY